MKFQPTEPILIDLAKTPDFSLGPAQVRPALRAFVSGGGEEQLEPRVMQVLIALARKAGEVVSRDDLVATCWGGRAIGEDAIQRAVAKARKLGEDSGAFAIETIPRVGYRLSAKDAGQPAPSKVETAAQPVLAVLAFDNLSGDPEMDFFSDGVSDEILQAVSRAIKTIGRASSFQLRGADKAVRKVAAELGATHVLDGSVRRGPGMVRISAQLIEAAGQTTIWQSQYDRPASDLFAMQEEIASAVAQALNLHLSPRPVGGEVDAETYELYLKQRAAALTAAINPRLGLDAVNEITRRAPNFGLGWAEAMRMRESARRNHAWSEEEAASLYDEARHAEARAIELLGENHPVLTANIVNWRPWCGQWTAHEARLRSALRDAPHDIGLLTTLCEILGHMGRCSEGLELARSVYEREPLHAAHILSVAGSLGALNRHDEEFAVYEQACRRWPDAPLAWRNMVSSAACEGRWDIVDRWATPDRIARYSQQYSYVVRPTLTTIEHYRNPTDTLREDLMRRLETELARNGRLRLISITHAAQFCDLDPIYDLIDKASFEHVFDPRRGFDPGDYGVQILFIATARELRTNPRFVTLCARLGLVAHWIETGRWPDCANSVRYDFRAECRKLADHPLG